MKLAPLVSYLTDMEIEALLYFLFLAYITLWSHYVFIWSLVLYLAPILSHELREGGHFPLRCSGLGTSTKEVLSQCLLGG